MKTASQSRSARVEIVVVGGGYAALIAVNRLLGSLAEHERASVNLTVVNPRDDFVERIRLHQLAAGSRTQVTRPLASLLHPAASVVRGTATRIDPARRRLLVDTGTIRLELPWTYLLYAVGSRGAATIPGARQHAFALGELEGAQQAAAAVDAAGAQPRIVVIGGGYTGVEAASEFAEQRPAADVTLVSAGPVVAGMRPAARSAVTRRLRRMGVTIIEGSAVVDVVEGKAQLADGQMLAFDACVLATAFDVPGLAADSGLAVDSRGRLLVDESLRSIDQPSILGAGDAVAVAGPVGARLRMACSTALPMGGHAAEVLLSMLRDEPVGRFSMGHSAQCISLGRRHGYIQLVEPDDTPRRLHITGVAGARIKEAVSRRVVDAPAKESTRPGAYTWKKGSPDPAP